MKALVLTQEQADKLLKMCHIIFPDLTFSLEIEPSYDGSDNNIYIQDLSLSQTGEYIPWFEFCMIILFKEFMKIKYINAPAFYTSILSGENPIDYLYKLFKKLKK